MTRDDAIAYGFRLAWRWVPVSAAVVIGSFIAIAALGNFFDQIEAANAFRRIAG
jgi:NO-binding membrane sensor protein with MHYT domain